MIRGVGYLRSLSDLEAVSVGNKGGTPIFLRDLGSVSFGPDIREGVADWNGEGETVGGIVVMRQGMNALNVIKGVEKRLKEIAPSLPGGVQIVSGTTVTGLLVDGSFGAYRPSNSADWSFDFICWDGVARRELEHYVAGWPGAGNWRACGCCDRNG